MRYLVLLVAVLLAGCAAEAKYAALPPEIRPVVLESFGASDLESRQSRLYGFPQNTVIVIARGPDGINYKASRLSRSSRGLDDTEHWALHHCGLYKEDDENCYIVFRGGWIGD